MIVKPEDITLRGERILIKRFEPETKGYVVSDKSEDKPFFGEVVNISDDIKEMYPIGSLLVFGMHATSKISINGKLYFLLREHDVVGTIEKKPE